MAEPLRDRILDQIVLELQGITGVRPWGGAYPSGLTVTRRFRGLVATPEWPTLIVVPSSGSRLTEVATGGAGEAEFTHAFRVVVYGYVQGDDVTVPSRWMLRLQQDVVDTLLAAMTLGGLASYIIPQEDETDEGLAEELGGWSAFAQHFLIQAGEYKAVG